MSHPSLLKFVRIKGVLPQCPNSGPDYDDQRYTGRT